MIMIRIKNKKYSIKWMDRLVVFTELDTGVDHIYDDSLTLSQVVKDITTEYPDGIPF